jgi:hypothetical protein
MSAGRLRAERERRKITDIIPDKKPCSGCRQVKPINNFTMKRRMLKTGLKVFPSAKCKACEAARQREIRRQRKETMTPEEIREMHRRWNANRDPEKRRAYQREWKTIQRRKAGAKPNRVTLERFVKPETVPLGPFMAWVRATFDIENHLPEVADTLKISERRLRTLNAGYEWKNGKKYVIENISVDVVDRALLAYGGTTFLWDLYPELYR